MSSCPILGAPRSGLQPRTCGPPTWVDSTQQPAAPKRVCQSGRAARLAPRRLRACPHTWPGDTMKSPLSLGLVIAGLGTGCAMESLDSGQQSLTGGNYVAMGDSYASGTGTREYYDTTCQRSNHAYAKQLAARDGLNLAHVACS